jgi:glutamyl-tRNA synthetase
VKKLEWMNGQHLAQAPIGPLDAYLRPFVVEAGLATAEELEARTDWWHRLLELLRVRARTVPELVAQCHPYFLDDFAYDADAVAKQWKDASASADLLRAVRDCLAASEGAPGDGSCAASLGEQRGVGAGRSSSRCAALTGVAATASSMSPAIGRDRSLAPRPRRRHLSAPPNVTG